MGLLLHDYASVNEISMTSFWLNGVGRIAGHYWDDYAVVLS